LLTETRFYHYGNVFFGHKVTMIDVSQVGQQTISKTVVCPAIAAVGGIPFYAICNFVKWPLGTPLGHCISGLIRTVFYSIEVRLWVKTAQEH
jgi:hypothetical protein